MKIKSFRKFLSVAVILVVGYGTGVALVGQASAETEIPFPQAKLDQIDSPTPAVIDENEPEGPNFRDAAADSGSDVEIQEIKSVLPDLLKANLLNYCLPSVGDYAKLASQEAEIGKTRNLKFDQILAGQYQKWAKALAHKDLHRQLQAAKATNGNDGTVDYCDDAELIVYKWEGIQVDGNTAYAQFEGELKASRIDGGGTFAAFRSQFQIHLVRGGANGWRMLNKVEESREPQG